MRKIHKDNIREFFDRQVRIVDDYHFYLRNSNLKASTQKEYDDICYDIHNALLEIRNEMVKDNPEFAVSTVGEIAQFIGRNKSHSYNRKMRIVYKNALNYAHHELIAGEIVVPSQKSNSYPTWTMDEYEYFTKNAGRTASLIAKVAYNTGQRMSDAVLIPEQDARFAADGKGLLVVKQEKTGTNAYIPITDELIDVIMNCDYKYLIHDVLGNKLSASTASRYIKKEVLKLEMRKDLSAHGLRKLRASVLAENGCSAFEIASVTGHLSMQSLSVYTEKYNRRIAAQNILNKGI